MTTFDAKVPPDFSHIEMFMVDPNTLYQFTQPQAEVITSTGKPVFGLGRGIYVLYYTGLYLGGYKCATYSEQDLSPKNPTHDVWHTPNDLGTISADISILLTSANVTFFNKDVTTPGDTEWLGFRPGSTGYASLAFEQTKYAFWGFVCSPATFTQDGKDLLINAIEYALSGAK